jgi:hypothetical protein
MSAQQAEKPRTSAAKADPNAAPPIDERDAAIARLERALAEERESSTQLRAANEAQRFQLQVLEKSYSKQLADARQRCEAAERELGEHKARLAALGTGGEDTLKLLGDTRAELARANAQLEQLRAEIAARRDGKTPGYRRDADTSMADGTINQLMSVADWPRDRKEAAGGQLHAQVQPEPDAPVEMIAPELVFTRGKKDDDDER